VVFFYVVEWTVMTAFSSMSTDFLCLLPFPW